VRAGHRCVRARTLQLRGEEGVPGAQVEHGAARYEQGLRAGREEGAARALPGVPSGSFERALGQVHAASRLWRGRDASATRGARVYSRSGWGVRPTCMRHLMSTIFRRVFSFSLALALAFVVLPGRALAANILFVSDNGSDTNIPTALMGDGHDV